MLVSLCYGAVCRLPNLRAELCVPSAPSGCRAAGQMARRLSAVGLPSAAALMRDW